MLNLNGHWPFLLMKAAIGNSTCSGDQITL
jgi:hypothetical protein